MYVPPIYCFPDFSFHHYVQRLLLFVTNPFWKDIINSIKYKFGKSSVTWYSDLFGMLLWYNDILRLQLVGVILDEHAEMIELEYLQAIN